MAPITGRARALQADQIVIGTQRISLFGIDAPDPDQDRECFAGRTFYGCATNAKRALEILVDLGPVTCTDTGLRNYVNFPYMTCKLGELDIAEDLVRDGWAFAFRRQSDKYVEAEAQAKAARKGMWQDGIRYTLPWEWREMNGRPVLGP
jgi:endonuclease YncB( thermonuclease family)